VEFCRGVFYRSLLWAVAFWALMVSKGATPIIEPKTYPWGLRSCYVADPEGNLIEIATWKSQNA